MARMAEISLIPIKPRSSTSRKVLWIFAVPLTLLLASGMAVRAQTAETLAQVKNVSVESFGQDDAARELRERLVEGLRTNGKLAVVADSKQADAIIKGTCSIWISGYFSTDPRIPASTRQPIYQGFLSVEIVGKDSQPLWSYLVTPSRLPTKPITKDLAGHMVRELVGAFEQESARAPGALENTSITETTLNGAGTTFPAPLYQEWFESFEARHRNLHIVYRAVGTEDGVKMLTQGKVDFAASDKPLSEENKSESQMSFLHFATVLGAVVPVYNLKGVDENLNFTGETLAGIYLGEIEKWDDPRIRACNRNVHLPNTAIVVIHRSDDSGSTFLWTDYLSKVSAEWRKTVGAGSAVRWPVGEGAEGNEAAADLIRNTPNSIGYVGLIYALRHQLNYGAVRNAAGEFVQADLDSVTAAARGASEAMTSDVRTSITNTAAKDAYPIVAFSWWLLPRELGARDKKAALVDLLQWVLTSGQKECAGLAYAPLPRDIATRELELLSTLK